MSSVENFTQSAKHYEKYFRMLPDEFFFIQQAMH